MEAALAGAGDGVGQAADVVAPEGGTDATGVVEEVVDTTLVVRVGLFLLLEDRDRPVLGPRDDGLEVPVGALHEADLQRRLELQPRPGHEVLEVVEAVLQVGLEDGPELRPVREGGPQATDQLDGQVLRVVLLHVEEERRPELARPLADRSQAIQGLRQARLRGERGEERCEGRGLHRDVDPGDGPPGVPLEMGIVRPGRRLGREDLEELRHPPRVAFGLGVGDGLLPEEVDGGRLAGPPQPSEPGHGVGR